ncbi:MAG: PASTA domain-containing protein [Oscillospiraceae bacterium]|nr:PASTA domain-containing protein [Oscillospiraceae bacterium]
MTAKNIEICYGCMSHLPNNENVCPYCGYARNTPVDMEYLPPSTVIGGRYLLGRVTHRDHEGITYIGLDMKKQIRVWVKEYMPREICRRNHATYHVVPSAGREAQYKSFAESFKDTATKLHSLDSPSLISPVNGFEERGTIYTIYQFVSAISLSEYLISGNGELSWTEAKKMFMPVLNALSTLHKHGIIHGHISPASLLIDQHGNVYLTALNLSGIEDPQINADSPEKGYFAPEQFLHSLQTPATDVYSMGAVLYKCLTGTMPTDAPTRKNGGSLLSVAELGGGSDAPENVSNAVACAMQLEKDDRPQSIDAFIGKLLESEKSNTAVYVAPRPQTSSIKAVKIEEEEEEEESYDTYDAEPEETVERKPKTLPVRSQAARSTAKFISGITLAAFIVIMIAAVGVLYTFRDVVFPTDDESPVVSEDIGDMPTVPVPVFEGKKVDNVIATKQYISHFVFQIEETFNEDYPQGVIYYQDPQPGENVPDKSTVTLFVSQGSRMSTMPDLVGSNLEYAEKIMTQSEITYELVEVEREDAEPRIILETQPAAGSKIDKDVDIVLLFILKTEDGQSDQLVADDDYEHRTSEPGQRTPRETPGLTISSEDVQSDYPVPDKTKNSDKEVSETIDENGVKIRETEKTKTFYKS